MNPAKSWWGIYAQLNDSRELPPSTRSEVWSDQQHVSSASSSPMYISKTPQMKPIPWPQIKVFRVCHTRGSCTSAIHITLSCQVVLEWATRLPGVFASVSINVHCDLVVVLPWIFLVCICHWWLSPQALAIPNLCIENWIGTEHVQKLLLSKALFVLSHSKRWWWWRMKWPWTELMKFFHVAVWLQQTSFSCKSHTEPAIDNNRAPIAHLL